MKKIKLKKGLIAIGGIQKIGKTTFAIQLANKIAKKEKVLYLNWTDYADRLHDLILKNNKKIYSNLDINTNLDFFNVGSFIQIMDLIEENRYKTVFIDDINYFTQTGETDCALDEYNKYGKDSAMKALRFLVDKYNIRIVFNMTIDTNFTPKLADFVWSRLIINDCDQVLALSYNKKRNKIKLFQLKDKNMEIMEQNIYL